MSVRELRDASDAAVAFEETCVPFSGLAAVAGHTTQLDRGKHRGKHAVLAMLGATLAFAPLALP